MAMYFNHTHEHDALYEVKQYSFQFQGEDVANIFVHDLLNGTYRFEIRFTDGRVPPIQQVVASADASLPHIPATFSSLQETLQAAIDEVTVRCEMYLA